IAISRNSLSDFNASRAGSHGPFRGTQGEALMRIGAMLFGSVLATVSLAQAALAQPSNTKLRREALAPAPIKARLQARAPGIRPRRLSDQVGFTRAIERPRASLLGDVDDPLFTPAYRAEVQQRATQLIKLDDDLRREALLANPRLRRIIPDILVLQ